MNFFYLRFTKDHKRTETTVFESQEKAFWSIMRPKVQIKNLRCI
jgi:hypothetical protein